MKVAVINNLYKPYARGGAEVVAAEQVSQLMALGHEVIVITTLPKLSIKSVDSNSVIKIYRLGGLGSWFMELAKIPTPLRLCWHFLNLFNFNTARNIVEILKKESIDLVISNNLMGLGFITPAYIADARIKHLHILHDIQLLHPSGLMYVGQENIIDSIFAKTYQAINRFFFRNINYISAPSSWLLQLHGSKNFFANAKQLVVANPVEFINDFPDRNYNGTFRILFAGQLARHKGLDILLAAVSDLPGDWSLHIFGDGPLKNEVVAASLRDNRITHQSWNESSLHDIMQQSDVLVVPSTCYENYPVAIVRAISATLPVLASRIGGIPEIISSQQCLFEPNSESLRVALEWAQNNRSLLLTETINMKKIITAKSANGYMTKILTILNEA